jgi:hypothetical protein
MRQAGEGRLPISDCEAAMVSHRQTRKLREIELFFEDRQNFCGPATTIES